MIFITGPFASGKRDYVIDELGFSQADIADAVINECPVVDNVQDMVYRDVPGSMQLIDALAGKEVVICDEVGSGVIPVERDRRVSREAVGRLAIMLAKRADKVIRIVCGIPAVIKDESTCM